MASYSLKTLRNTLFKAAAVQASELPVSDVVKVAIDGEYPVAAFDTVNNHYRFTLGKDADGNQVIIDGRNTWYVFQEHVRLTQKQSAAESTRQTSVNGSIIWTDPNCRISKHFTAREVTNGDYRRIPTDPVIVKNILLLAKELDAVREAWDSPIGVTSFFRPPEINRAVGGVSNSQHVYGNAADIYDMMGRDQEFEKFLDRGWGGALGYGVASGRGFTHLDLRGGGWKRGNGAIRWSY